MAFINGTANFSELLNGTLDDDIIDGLGAAISGTDVLKGDAGNDTYMMKSHYNRTWIEDTSGALDTVSFDASLTLTDLIFSSIGNDFLVHSNANGASNFELRIRSHLTTQPIERFTFSDGATYTISGTTLTADSGNNIIHAASGNYELHGGAGNDVMSANSAHAIYGSKLYGDAGDDILNGGTQVDELHGGTGDDILNAQGGDYLYGEDGNDILNGNDGNDWIDGGVGNDTLRTGDGGNNQLFGGSGDDILISEEKTSGAGNYNELQGDAGDDTYVINLNSHTTHIDETASSAPTDIDSVQFGTDILLEELYFTGSGSSLLIESLLGSSTLNVLIQQQLLNTTDPSYTTKIDEIIFTDGSTFTLHGRHLYGDNNANTITAAEGNYHQHGGGGDDTIYGNETYSGLYGGVHNGVDQLHGDAGNDVIYGLSGADHLYGGDGNDVIYGGDHNDVLEGGDGCDKLYSGNGNLNTLRGGAGSDILVSDANTIPISGNNSLYGGIDSDVYVFGLDSHTTEVFENNGQGTGDRDTIKFGPGIAYADLTFTHSTGTLKITTTLGNYIQIVDQEYNTHIEHITFTDNNDIYTIGTGTSGTVLTASNNGETHYLTADGDVFDALGGDDTVYGREGNDVLTGGSGDDDLYGEKGSDTLHGGAGADDLYGGKGIDTLYGGDGEDNLYSQGGGGTSYGEDGDDTLHGQAGVVTTMHGGAGNDTLISYGGADVMNGDAGNDIFHAGMNVAINGGADIDRFYSFNAIEGIVIDTTAATLATASAPTTPTGSIFNVETFYLSSHNDTLTGNNTNETVQGYAGDDLIHGGGGDDKLYGGADNDTINGDSGIDKLYGHDGDDILSGGADVDSMRGDAGADTFLFESATAFTGRDYIQDFKKADGDKIDIADLLTGYDNVTDNITDYVQITETATDSFLYVDTAGTGAFAPGTLIAKVIGITGLTDEQALETDGFLFTG